MACSRINDSGVVALANLDSLAGTRCMTASPIATERDIKQLLQLARVPSGKRPVSWLEHALVAARAFNRAAKQRPLPADRNQLLADVAKTAKALTRLLQRLRSHPSSWHAFWRAVVSARAGTLARRAVSEDDVRQQLLRRPDPGSPPHDRDVLSMLAKIERAAQIAKDPRMGRPREARKQHVVDLAFAFFVRYSPLEASGTPTGPFAKFARAFYAVALKINPDSAVGLDRQIRQAVKRLYMENERAGIRQRQSNSAS